MPRVRPRGLHRSVAIAEAITWALLLIGMFLKYVTETTELGVQVFGMVHGVVFIAYCLTTVVLWVDQEWPLSRLALGLLAAVPPFATVPFARYAERTRLMGGDWRLLTDVPQRVRDHLVARLLRRPAQGLVVALVAVAGLTGVALVVGPPS